MPTGTIARLLIDKGFGFIRDETGVEHFFHRSSVRGAVFELLREGQRVDFQIEKDGSVRLKPVSGSVRELYGCLRRTDVPSQTLEDLEEALIESLAADDERIRRGGR